MRGWPGECVDLIYLDPPFKSGTNYNILFGTKNGKPAQVQAFEDTWTWTEAARERLDAITNAVGHPAHKSISGLREILGPCGMLSYLSYMAQRLAEMKRILKPTGSIYLHCDPTASHYLKILLDEIFGGKNFRNEIAWHYRTYQGNVTQYYPKKHDIIFWYAKDEKKFRKQNVFQLEYMDNYKDTVDYDRWGKFYVKGSNKIKYGKHPKADSRFRAYLDKWIKDNGRKPKTGEVIYECKGYVIDDVWMDIQALDPKDTTERLGYPTQKPIALLERIIRASCPLDGIVLDPFCGCGTAIDAARKLKRQWIGVDISSFAIDLIVNLRLQDSSIRTVGVPLDLAGAKKLAQADRFGFEKWAINKMPGFVPNQKQVGDGGVDGRAMLMHKVAAYSTRLAIAQVKSGGLDALLSNVREFLHVLRDEPAVCGVFVTMEKIGERKEEARKAFSSMGNFEVGANSYPRVQFWSIEEYFDGRFPNLPPMRNPYTGESMDQRILI